MIYTFSEKSRLPGGFRGSFFLALIPNTDIKMVNSKKIRAHTKFIFFENAWEVKKSECDHVKWGPIVRKMTRGFQIRPQNLNRVTFDPLLA